MSRAQFTMIDSQNVAPHFSLSSAIHDFRSPLRFRTAAAFLLFTILAVSAIAQGPPADSAPLSLSVEWASLQTYPDADCTKIKVYLKNPTDKPIGVFGVMLDDKRFLDMITFSEAESGIPRGLLDEDLAPAPKGSANRPKDKPRGALQWHRVLPNPVEPQSISEMTISLRGIVKSANLKIGIANGPLLPVALKESKPPLRLSHIAFDPFDPNNIFIYCENRGDHDIRVDHIVVDSEVVSVEKSIPSGNGVAARKKTCFIVHPARKMAWGRYAGIGVVGSDGERIVSLVRVANLFPIGAYDGDTRSELFFDSTEFALPVPENDKSSNNGESAIATSSVAASSQVRRLMRDPFRGDPTIEDSARTLIRRMAELRSTDASMPSFTNMTCVRKTVNGFFGDIPDAMLLHPYHLRRRGPGKSAEAFRVERLWMDPKPSIGVGEAFSTNTRPAWDRELTTDEVSYAAWELLSEGAKGIQYYQRRNGPNTVGYAAMPRVQAAMARDALNMQLLKGFLRIGDVMPLNVAIDTERATCRAVLCADKAVVLFVLAKPVRWQESISAQWERLGPVQVSFRAPEGFTPGSLYELDQGLTPIQFTSEAEVLVFERARLSPVNVFLCLSDSMSAPATAISQANVSLQHGQDPAMVITQCRAQVASMAQPLLDPQAEIALDRAVALGTEIGAVRKDVFSVLREAEKPLDGLPHEESARRLMTLADAYATIGYPEDAVALCERWRPSIPEKTVADIFLHVAELHSLAGRSWEAAAFLDGLAAMTSDRTARSRLLREVINIQARTLRDPERAIGSAERLRAEYPGDPRFVSRMNVEISSLMIAVGRAQEAVELLNAVDRTHAADLPMDHLYGMAYHMLRDYPNAREHYRIAAQGEDDFAAQAQFMAGMVTAALGDYSAAAEAFGEVSRRFPESPYAARAASCEKRTRFAIVEK